MSTLRLLVTAQVGHCAKVATSSLTEAVFSLPELDQRGCVALVRDFTRRATSTCGYAGNHEDVVLVVSELATNAVSHGGLPIVRIIGGRDQIFVEVADDDVARPALRDGGWGLRLVTVLSTRWGVAEHDGRKVVWCELTA